MEAVMKSHFILAFLLFTGAGEAQIKVTSVNIGPVYNAGFFLAETFNDINGLGVETSVKLDLTGVVRLLLTAGYNDLKVDQNNPIKNWNWGFYIEPYSRLISSQLRDTTYKANFIPNQRLYLIPVEIVIMVELPLFRKVNISLGAGGGLQLYQRHLWVHEYWSRYYPDADYTFQYDYNNDAGLKVGTVYTVKAVAQVSYALSRHLGASFNLAFTDFWGAQNKQAFREFPMRSLFSGGLYLSFYY